MIYCRSMLVCLFVVGLFRFTSPRKSRQATPAQQTSANTQIRVSFIISLLKCSVNATLTILITQIRVGSKM